jgi:hypothetical protein
LPNPGKGNNSLAGKNLGEKPCKYISDSLRTKIEVEIKFIGCGSLQRRIGVHCFVITGNIISQLPGRGTFS